METDTSKLKLAALLLIVVLMASNITAVKAISVGSIPKPSAPEFTVKIVSYPYDVPSKTTIKIDQYTGKETTTTQPGYHVENKSIEIRITNPPFTPISITEITYWSEEQQKTCTYDCNYTADLYYSVRVKGHFGNEWNTTHDACKVQLDSKYTVFTISSNYPKEAKIDFQVRASIGYFYPVGRSGLIMGYKFSGKYGDWSNIQILTMGEIGSTAVPDNNQPTPMPAPTPMPTATAPDPTATPTKPIPQTDVIFFLQNQVNIIFAVWCIVIGVLVIALAFYRRRVSNKMPKESAT